MLSPLPLDPYEVLGVSKDAALPAIRSAHRKLVLKFHPDRIKDDAERQRGSEQFQKAQQAYELLADEKRRARYDDQVKLAALRKEAMMSERTMPIRSQTFTAPSKAPPSRPPPTATYSYHDGRAYEERRPRYSDDDERYSSAPRSTRRPSTAHERRPATSQGEDRKKKSSDKFSGFGSYVESKLREKAKQAREKATHSETARQREKDRKREAEAKYSARRAPYVESDDSSSDSDTVINATPRRPEPKRRPTYESSPKKTREPARQPESKRSGRESTSTSSSSSSEDEWDGGSDKWINNHRSATAYISERSIPGRPGVLRTDSAHYYSPRDHTQGRKSGSDRDEHRDDRTRSSKPQRPVETESSRRKTQTRKPTPLQTATSSPAGLKGMNGHRDIPQAVRSPTVEYAPEHKRPVPSMPRSNTMPVPQATRKDSGSGRGSKLKHAETQDSGYGSSGPNTPEYHGTSPPKSSKKYFIVEEDPEHSRGSFRTVPLDSEKEHSRRNRSPSPARDRERERDRHRDRDRKRAERPSIQTDLPKPSRSASYTMSPEPLSARQGSFRTEASRSAMRGDAPPLARGDSSRTLYGEVPRDDGFRFSPENVRYSPKTSDVRYARRGSGDHRDKDYFSGSSHFDSLHSPRQSRGERVH